MKILIVLVIIAQNVNQFSIHLYLQIHVYRIFLGLTESGLRIFCAIQHLWEEMKNKHLIPKINFNSYINHFLIIWLKVFQIINKKIFLLFLWNSLWIYWSKRASVFGWAPKYCSFLNDTESVITCSSKGFVLKKYMSFFWSSLFLYEIWGRPTKNIFCIQ